MNPSGSGPGSPPLQDVSPRGRERRALRLGLLASLALHLLVLTMWTILPAPFGSPRTVGEEEELRDPRVGMDVVVILETDEAPEPSAAETLPDPLDPVPEIPAEIEAPSEPVEAGEPEPDPGEEEDATVEGPGLSVAEQLRPRMIDPRLWAPVDPRHTDLTEAEKAELLLRGMIQSWNDSMAVAEALSDRATDWTYTDSEGRRWGLAPGRLHLGDFSIPLPLAFDVPPHLRQEWSQRQWMLDDLSRGAINAQIQETWADRARTIRARMEAERAGGADPGTDGGGR